jgi:hypothetical protein
VTTSRLVAVVAVAAELAIGTGCSAKDRQPGGAGAAAAVGGAAGAGGATGGTSAIGGTAGTSSGGATGGTGGATGGAGGLACQPPLSGCDNSPQCGCPGQNCIFAAPADGTTFCVAAGSVPPYNPCTQTSGMCKPGSSCTKNTKGGVCVPFCSTVADCPGADRACVQIQGLPSLEGTRQCTAGCDLVNYSAVCGPGVGCVPVDDGAGKIVGDCRPVGTNTGPGGCSAADPDSCAPGYVCKPPDTCVRFCRIGAAYAADCPGMQCIGFSKPVLIGTITYGYCA